MTGSTKKEGEAQLGLWPADNPGTRSPDIGLAEVPGRRRRGGRKGKVDQGKKAPETVFRSRLNNSDLVDGKTAAAGKDD